MVEDVVTVKHVAKVLDLTDAAVYLAIKEGRIASRTVLDKITVPKAELERLKKEKIRRARKPNGTK